MIEKRQHSTRRWCGAPRRACIVTAAFALFASICAGFIDLPNHNARFDSVAAESITASPNTAPTNTSPAPSATLTPKTAAAPTSTPTPKSGSVKAQAPPIDRHAVISYLGQLISWYRQIAVEDRLASEPADTLFVADNRRLAAQILSLGFDYARAQAALLKNTSAQFNASANASSKNIGAEAKPGANVGATNASPIPSLNDLVARRDQAQADLDKAKAQVQQLQASLAHANRRTRDQIQSELVAAQGQVSLAQSHVDSLNAMIEFEAGAEGGRSSSGLEAQIDELQRSVPQAGQNAEPPSVASAAANSPAATGILGRAENLIALGQREQALANRIEQTQELTATAENLSKSILQELTNINQQGLAITAQAASADIAAIQQSKMRVQQLTQRHKQVVAAILPLSKQMVVLNLYSSNLERWRAAMRRQFTADLRSLLIRLGGLAILLGAVFIGAIIWRQLTFRYVHDIQRRYQLLQLRRIIVIVIVALVLLFDFANELGALATVMGFAAAGIALTLQNVILSLAGYFYVSGRFGIRVGDRVQISGINGDVLEIGLFKMTLMELGSDEYGRQPTGRVVVFPNSVVFQPNGNFYKQLPGSNFTWNELRLTLAPDCDYRLAEKRLVEVVNDVFARYRDTIQREYRGVERDLNIRIETPRPQSRLQVSESGIEIVIRYPAQLQNATQTSDEIARRLIDAIKREPGLKLAVQGTPSIQKDQQPEPAEHSPGGSSPPPANSRQSPEPAPTQPTSGPIDNVAAATVAAAAVGVTAADSVIAASHTADSTHNAEPAHDEKHVSPPPKESKPER